ncbi:helix-turn-helix domain-containing protein [Hyphomicrobium sp.]|nr:helix-turn-helix domain-containing protein [Hyphomicrobium sp.]
MQSLDAKRRKKIEARATELVAEEMSLRDLRKALDKTQVKIAKTLGIKQDGVSRIEKRSDLLLSTLRSYVEAMGGELRLIAEFPDRPPVALSGVAEPEAQVIPAKPARHSGKDKHSA